LKICKILNIWPELVSFEKAKAILTRDPVYWQGLDKINAKSKNGKNMTPGYFSFKDFMMAFELMSIPEKSGKNDNPYSNEIKVKFFSKLHKAIEKLNIQNKSMTMKAVGKTISPTVKSYIAGKNTPEMNG